MLTGFSQAEHDFTRIVIEGDVRHRQVLSALVATARDIMWRLETVSPSMEAAITSSVTWLDMPETEEDDYWDSYWAAREDLWDRLDTVVSGFGQTLETDPHDGACIGIYWVEEYIGEVMSREDLSDFDNLRV